MLGWGSPRSGPTSAAVVPNFVPKWALRARIGTEMGATGADVCEGAEFEGPEVVDEIGSIPSNLGFLTHFGACGTNFLAGGPETIGPQHPPSTPPRSA